MNPHRAGVRASVQRDSILRAPPRCDWRRARPPLRATQERFLNVWPPEGVQVNLLTGKPTGSVIDVTVSWPTPPDSRLWRYVDRLLMALFLCGWARALVCRPVSSPMVTSTSSSSPGSAFGPCSAGSARGLVGLVPVAPPRVGAAGVGRTSARPRRPKPVLGPAAGTGADSGSPVGHSRIRTGVGRGAITAVHRPRH
jgi:hypothetical protein